MAPSVLLRSAAMVSLAAGVVLWSAPASAQWSMDPAARTPLCTADGWQSFPIVVQVDGGFVVAWRDMRRSPSVDVYAQKLTIDGGTLWPVNGRVVAEGPAGALAGHLQELAGVTDGLAGGALITWNDAWAATTELGYITRIAADGSVGWGNPGVQIQGTDTAVPLADVRGYLCEPQIYGLEWYPVADSEGGAFVPFHPWGSHAYFITRFGPDGSLRDQWYHEPTDGGGREMALVAGVEPGGRDSVIVSWAAEAAGIAARARKLVDPEVQWPAGPDTLESPWGAVQLGASPWVLTRFHAAPDGAGGVVSAWIDDRTGGQRAYAQRIAGDGTVLWTAGGVEVSGSTLVGGGWSWSQQLAVSPDGAGGAVVVWNLNDDHTSVRAQRVAANGSLLWGPDGVDVIANQVGMPSFWTQALDVVRTTDGGFVVLYLLDEPGFEGLIAQKIGAAGQLEWGQGRTVYSGCISTYSNFPCSTVSDGQAGVIVVFSPCEGNLYAHRIGANYVLDDGFDLGNLGMWTGVGP